MYIAESATEKNLKSENIWHSYGHKDGLCCVLSSSFSSVVARRTKCTRQPPSCLEPNICQFKQEAQLSPRDRAMRRVSWNLANCHATVRQVLNKSKLWSWWATVGTMCNKHVHSTMTRSSCFHCPIGVINETDHGRVVDFICIPTTCCGEIF